MSKRLFKSRPLVIDMELATKHQLTWDAAGIAEFIFLNSKTNDKGPTVSEVATYFNISASRATAGLKMLKTLGFADWDRDKGVWVTDSYHDTFVLQVVDPKTKLNEVAVNYLEFLAKITGKKFTQRSVPNAEAAIAKLWSKDPTITAKDIRRVALYCKQVEYTKPDMQKYLRTSTLLNKEFFNRLDNANAWVAEVQSNGLFTNQNQG